MVQFGPWFFFSLFIELIFIIIYFIKFYRYFSNMLANLKRIATDRTRFTVYLFNHSTWAIGMECNKWNCWIVNIRSYSNKKTVHAHTVQDQRATSETTHRRCYLPQIKSTAYSRKSFIFELVERVWRWGWCQCACVYLLMYLNSIPMNQSSSQLYVICTITAEPAAQVKQ